jgi:hypothetical protein
MRRLVVAESQARGRRFGKSKAMRTLDRSLIDSLDIVLGSLVDSRSRPS